MENRKAEPVFCFGRSFLLGLVLIPQLFFLTDCKPRPSGRPDLSRASRWACFYGASMPAEFYQALDFAILDSDTFQSPPNIFKTAHPPRKPYRIGYVSVGEAEEYRWYWPKIKGKEFVLEPNPNWPQSHYVDIRSEEWRNLLFEEIVPAVLNKGYHGVFLDTLDTAEYLEWKDPQKYSGSLKSMERFVLDLRQKFPDILIITNNALPLLEKWGGQIDGALVEDLYTHYNFDQEKYESSAVEEDLKKETRLLSYQAASGRPVFVILYGLSDNHPVIRAALEKTKRHGFHPYRSTISLNEIGTVLPQSQ